MDVRARQAILSIPEEHLRVAKAAEVELYAHALEIHSKLLTPLDYAVSCSGARRYRHVELLNAWIMALIEGRMYFDGPGPEPRPLTDEDDPGDLDVSGYTGQPIPDDLDADPERIEFLLQCEPGLAYDDAGNLIKVHPERGDRPVYNLAISMPPRHGKSFLVSEHLPGWFLSNYPNYSVLLASYEATFAANWGGKVRDHICDHPEFGISVAGGKQAAKMQFDLDATRGFMKCAGVGGPLTGSGGQLIIVDDPIKNAEEAMSPTIRDAQEAWWHSTLYSRREPWEDGTPGRVILMATRWHEDDLTGKRVPETPKMGDQWAKINLMALFEPNDDEPVDLLGRKPGQALCPPRFTAQALRDTRDNSEEGLAWFEALYQGHPSLDDGNLIMRPFNYYELEGDDEQGHVYKLTDREGSVRYIHEDDCYRFATFDPAGVESKRADYSVFLVMDVVKQSPRVAMVRAVHRVKIDSDLHEEKVKEWYARWSPRAVHIENKTFGTSLIKRLSRVPGIIVAKLTADKNKVFRALPVKYEVANENVWFPKLASWLRDFEREVVKFPNTTHDDQVDALAYAVQVYKALPEYLATPEKEPETLDEKVAANMKAMAKQNQKGRRGRYPIVGRW